MAGKRRTRAEIEADEAEAKAEFIHLFEEYKKDHPPEACTCAGRLIGTHQMDPDFVFGRFPQQLERVQSEMERAVTGAKLVEYEWKTLDIFGLGPCERCKSYEGKRFRYDSPPPGGHPGTVPGCHCRAAPFVPGYKGKKIDWAKVGLENQYFLEWKKAHPNWKEEGSADAGFPKRKMKTWVKVLIGIFALLILAALFG